MLAGQRAGFEACRLQTLNVLHALEERLDRPEEVDAWRPVMHRHDPACLESLRDSSGLLIADRRSSPHGDEQQVDRRDRLCLFVAEPALPEVAKVTAADPVEVENEDRVRAALGPGVLVVLR